MENAVGTNHRIRFKAFELDLHTRELFRNGIRLRVQGHPVDVLEMLLEKPGELVTREQLRKKLWPENTFVDFEHNLNCTIARLRDALCDHAEDPKFIDTLPRLGYRFVAPVESEHGQPAMATTGIFPEAKLRSSPRRRWLWFVAAGILVAVGFALAWMKWFSAPPSLVVGSIEPLTHDRLAKYYAKNDGSRIYFSEFVHDRWLLSQVSVGGGEITRIASPLANTVVLDIAPDGTKLLVCDYPNSVPQALWVISLPSGTPRRLGALEGNDAAWSRNGKQLIFSKSSELWIADGDGANPKKLLRTSGVPYQMQFSPDGARIRYQVRSKNTAELWEARTDGSGAHALLPGWHSPVAQMDGVWSPDGRYYTFLEYSGIATNLWMLPKVHRMWHYQSAQLAQLTRGPLLFNGLSFGPDNRTLFAVGVLRSGELVRYDPATRQVSPYLSGVFAGNVAFSRDGQWIAYITYSDHNLWRCRIDGSNCQQLTNDGTAALPQWSPDSRSIAYVKYILGKPFRIAIIPMNGGHEEEAGQEEGNEVDANWSPDGTRMIFADYNTDYPESNEIRELDLVTHKVASIPGSKGLFSPRWSPDGRYLAALTLDSQRLMLFNFDKQRWTTWITAKDVKTENLAYPVWSKDSRFLYLGNILSGGLGDVEEWRLRPGQPVAVKILELHDETRFLGPFSTWSTVGPDGSIYFTRDRSSIEIYALHLSEK